jgi:tRNA threonylcarbamoyl adenosine modification protein YeaZ
VAIVDRDAGVIVERSSTDTRGHAELVGRFIQECLIEWGGSVTALSGVVAGMGPGPFTGLRVGIAAARAFAFGARKPVIPVVSHDAIALGASGPTMVVTDARRHELFWSTYSGSDAAGLPVRTAGPSLAKAAELTHDVADYDRLTHLTDGLVSAGQLGMVAELQYANRREFAADIPLYLRSPDVTVSAGPKRVTS